MTIPPIHRGQADQFLSLLGKDPAAARLRAFPHRKNPNKWHPKLRPNGIKARKGPYDLAAASRWQQEGRGVYLVINDGGDIDAEITACRAFFLEWDNRPVDWQLQAWREFGLGEPSAIIATGGKSAHLYWVLSEPISPADWVPIQAALIELTGADPVNRNPSRVMRLPGAFYLGPDGKASGQSTIHAISDHRYTVAEVAGWIAAQSAAAPADEPAADPEPFGPLPVDDLPPRPPEALREALRKLPQFSHNSGQYAQLLGLAMRLHVEIGAAEAQALLSETCCQAITDLPSYFQGTPTKISRGSVWPYLREQWGIDIARHDLRGKAAGGAQQGQQAPPRTEQANDQPRTEQAPPRTSRRSGEKRLSLTRRLACFDRCVQVEAARQRNSLTRRVRLLKAVDALGLGKFINRAEIAQRVLESKDAQQGHQFQPLTAAQRMAMERPRVEWLIHGLVPARDMTIVGGRAKVGKTRLALAIADSVLNESEILGHVPDQARTVILITDDQADGDSADMLEALGIWDHDGLIWSRHFRLTESDLAGLLRTVEANHGALVILDSLRSIGRSLQHGENDPEIGAILYDLKAAVIDAGGSLLVVHHCNKADGLIGTEALSGHNAIAGSANTILTLHYLPDQNGKPVKDAPQRRLVREARSGQGFDLVISGTAGSGRFHRVGTFAEFQETAKHAADDAKKQQRLSLQQREALEVLEGCGDWMTRRQVCEALGIAWGERGRDKDARRVDDSLRRLVDLGLAESMRAGTESTYRFLSHETLRTTRTSEPTSHTNDFEPF